MHALEEHGIKYTGEVPGHLHGRIKPPPVQQKSIADAKRSHTKKRKERFRQCGVALDQIRCCHSKLSGTVKLATASKRVDERDEVVTVDNAV